MISIALRNESDRPVPSEPRTCGIRDPQATIETQISYQLTCLLEGEGHEFHCHHRNRSGKEFLCRAWCCLQRITGTFVWQCARAKLSELIAAPSTLSLTWKRALVNGSFAVGLPRPAQGPKRPQRRNRSIASLDAEKPSAVKNSRAPSRPARRTQVICASESTIRLTNALPTPCRRCGAATTTIER